MPLRFKDVLEIEGEIQRGPYLTWGLILLGVKYTLDRVISLYFFDRRWFITDYFIQVDRLSITGLANQDIVFYGTLVVASVPFIWLGTLLCIKRFRNAGLPSWLVILFFVPMVNFLMFLVLSLLPEDTVLQKKKRTYVSESTFSQIIPRTRVGSIMLSLGMIVFISILMTIFFARFLGQYGWGLFVGVPFFLGFGSVLLYGYHEPRTYAQSMNVTVLAVWIFALFLLLLAIEGVLCILMALPLGFILAWIGGSIAYLIQTKKMVPSSTMIVCLSLFIPVLNIAVSEDNPSPPLQVRSKVLINSNSNDVWQSLIDFSEIGPPKETLFKLGIAYPTEAQIIGTGADAIRHCIFSTGRFIEPIYVWERPRLLKFSVKSQPKPLVELTPYRDLDVPHIDGYFTVIEGQFKLLETSSTTTMLEGTTWYRLNLSPGLYWNFWAKYIVHKIHYRVLNHIKSECETTRDLRD